MSDDLQARYPELPVSDALDARVADLAAAHDARRQLLFRPNLRPALAVAVTGGALLLGGVATTRVVAAQTLIRAADALGRVHTVQTTYWQETPTGPQTTEVWSDGVRERLVTTDGPPPPLISTASTARRVLNTTYFDGKRLWRRDDGMRYTTVRATNRLAAYVSSGPTVAHLRDDIRRWGWLDRMEPLPDATENGRTLRRVRLTRNEPAGPVRIELWVDPDTDLPLRTETHLYKDGAWKPIGGATLTYDAPMPVVFGNPLPGPILDLDAEAARWRKSLAQPVARLGKVALRRVEVSPEGNVFVLYTAGKSPEDAFRTDEKGVRWYSDRAGTRRDWRLDVTDDAKTPYARIPVDFATGIDPKTRQISLGDRPIVDGQKIEGDWFVPLTAEIPKRRPRRLTVTMTLAVPQPEEHNRVIPPTVQASVAPFAADTVPAWWEQLVGDGSLNATQLPPEKALAADAARARADHFVWNAPNYPVAWRWLEVEASLRPAADPSRYDLLFRRAECLGRSGDVAGARREIEAGIVAWPSEWKNRGQLYQDAARLYRALGDDAAADRMIEQAIAASNSEDERAWLRRSGKQLKRW